MTSRLTVVLVSLVLVAPVVIFWLWLVILPARVAKLCPEGCRCDASGYYVNCSDSALDSIPLTFPTDVRVLVIGRNNITFLVNDGFVSRKLTELEIIQADFCHLTAIELGVFNGLTNLKLLSMQGNKVNEIKSGTFKNMSSLEILNLQDNGIKYLDVDAFSGLINLQILYLERNKLQNLHPDTFVGLKNLRNLYLSQNAELEITNDRPFMYSLSLKHLNISGCNVSSVSIKTFANVSALEILDLNHNNLKTLDINILKSLPKLSTIYLYDNPLHCDCQLLEVWRWCQENKIRRAYKTKAPVCDTPSEVQGRFWGVLEKAQCLQGNIHFYADYNNTSYNFFSIEDTDTESEHNGHVSSFLKEYEAIVYAVPFIFGTTGNVILIIIITFNKDMRTVPNFYILNLAISDLTYLMVHFIEVCANKISDTWLDGELICKFLLFSRRLSVVLSAYSVAVLSVYRYKVTLNPFHVLVPSQSTWRATEATICGVWIVAALFAVPSALSNNLYNESMLLGHTTYNQLVVIFDLLVSCVFPLCVIAFSYIMAARNLVERSCSMAEATQSPLVNALKNTAKIVLGLTVVFLISYVPYHAFWTYIIATAEPKLSEVNRIDFVFQKNYIFLYTLLVLKCLLFLNSCLNPVALCCMSLAFRKQFKHYLTCSWKDNSPA